MIARDATPKERLNRGFIHNEGGGLSRKFCFITDCIALTSRRSVGIKLSSYSSAISVLPFTIVSGSTKTSLLHRTTAVRGGRGRRVLNRITLGVFTNNERARHCYEVIGFQATGKVITYMMPDGAWECIEMELNI